MPKPHPKKPHPKGAGTKLVPPVAGFISQFVKDPEEADWATDQVDNEGPEHKQVLNAVLLQQVAHLVKAIEAKIGQPFQMQAGETIVSHKEEKSIPVPFPLAGVKGKHQEEALEIIAKAPEHEALVYAMLQQVAVWGSRVLESLH